jgi:hypothetical protein
VKTAALNEPGGSRIGEHGRVVRPDPFPKTGSIWAPERDRPVRELIAYLVLVALKLATAAVSAALTWPDWFRYFTHITGL